MDVNERKMRVLQAIVEDFIRTNTPVGSRTISKSSGLGVSSATIRNEMADLEEMGYLIQPHVSAGRVPSDKAYRLYVEALENGSYREEEMDNVRAYFNSCVHDMEDVINRCAQTVSELTHYTALVMTPRQSDLRVLGLQLVQTGRGQALLIVVTDSGVIRDATVRCNENLDADSLYGISRMLTERFRGMTLRQMRETLNRFSTQSGSDAKVLSGIAELTAQIEKQTETDHVMVGGAHNMLYYPEYGDVSKARAFMDALEGDEVRQLMRPQGGSLTVRIGGEIGINAFRDCAMITAPYIAGRGHVGSVGVIGPIRMSYGYTMAVLDTVSRELTRMLKAE